MTNRYKPNEATCPVPIELLALLLRADEGQKAEVIAALSAPQRAALAAFCFSRCHMRDFAFEVAAHCDERSLAQTAGTVGEVLFDLSRERVGFDSEPYAHKKKKVTLARMAA